MIHRKRQLVFIHGLFMNAKVWQLWMRYFELRGYTCYAPSYPFHLGEPLSLRANPDPTLRHLTFTTVVDHYKDFIDNLDCTPILIGHSMGGLVVQKLIELNYGMAGICLQSAPPAGLFSFKLSFVRCHFPTVNPLKGNSICVPDVDWVRYAICHLLTEEAAKTLYAKFIVPESRNVPRSSLGKAGRIDFTKPHKPLLFIAGDIDHAIPSELVVKNFNAYRSTTSIKAYQAFAGRTHNICLQENWSEVADYISAWIETDLTNA
jgi:pimeloyl-ACP methyl ester carboxylesterase